ncbi:MAG: hypothetical protein HYZ40_02345 [Rhodospirillales bacterium]|nr:hypothetical protein [Rhodospirillales bacterium]
MRTLLNIGRSGLAALALSAVVAGTSLATAAGGWRLEEGVKVPSYAVAEPTASNLNIDVVALVCEEAGTERGLQLQIYLSSPGPLLPIGTPPNRLKDTARAEIAIDGQIFATDILFAGSHVVLADARRQQTPVLSDRLVEAMQAGRAMLLRFDLVSDRSNAPAAFDGEAEIDLRGGLGGKAVAAVRRCAEPASDRMASVAVTSP